MFELITYLELQLNHFFCHVGMLIGCRKQKYDSQISWEYRPLYMTSNYLLAVSFCVVSTVLHLNNFPSDAVI